MKGTWSLCIFRRSRYRPSLPCNGFCSVLIESSKFLQGVSGSILQSIGGRRVPSGKRDRSLYLPVRDHRKVPVGGPNLVILRV